MSRLDMIVSEPNAKTPRRGDAKWDFAYRTVTRRNSGVLAYAFYFAFVGSEPNAKAPRRGDAKWDSSYRTVLRASTSVFASHIYLRAFASLR